MEKVRKRYLMKRVPYACEARTRLKPYACEAGSQWKPDGRSLRREAEPYSSPGTRTGSIAEAECGASTLKKDEITAQLREADARGEHIGGIAFQETWLQGNDALDISGYVWYGSLRRTRKEPERGPDGARGQTRERRRWMAPLLKIIKECGRESLAEYVRSVRGADHRDGEEEQQDPYADKRV